LVSFVVGQEAPVAKKKKQAESSSESAAAPSKPSGPTPEVVRVEQAFSLGNYSFVRKAANDDTQPAARDAAKALLPRVVVEPVQVMVGLVGLVVVLTAWALSATTGG
jgi:hypothetical protein